MGFFGLGKKKDLTELKAPATGAFVEIEKVSDPVFAQKMMGDGFAINPEDAAIYSPVTGSIVSVFKTKHAIGLQTSDGLEVLLHLGIDTVDLNGAPFEVFVKEGDAVTPDTKLATMDVDQVVAAGKDPVVMTIVTNTADKVETIDFKKTNDQATTHGDVVAEIKTK